MSTAAQCEQTGVDFFTTWFHTLRGFSPYPWQTKLFNSNFAGNTPDLIYVPTGGGKTDVITVWLLATLSQIQQTGTTNVPRRLYLAVDRRAVVDQTELIAKVLFDKINNEPDLFDLLKSQTLAKTPLVISVLRGQRVAEQEPIISDPSCFAIVLCTPDMVLSRLLFSAYACSRRVASREAGLVGHDAWIVLDEAHISDAGRRTLEYVKQHNNGIKPWWCTCMTATPRSDGANKLTLCEKDLELMGNKLQSQKGIKIVETLEKDIVANVLNTVSTLDQPWNRLIVYVERPQHAAKICNALKEHNVSLLTGTMRGLEKSKLDFAPFKQGAVVEKKNMLVCTSAGELGLDVSCDFLITEFTYVERLQQRLGRLNRWGECQQAYGYILKVNEAPTDTDDKAGEKEQALNATLDYLRSLPTADGWTDMSGFALYQHPAPAAAFGPPPKSLTLNEAILAQLANTSVEHDIPVEQYIRGLNAEYHVNLVIRKKQELDALTKMDEEDLQNYVAAVPVKTGEIFKEPSSKELMLSLSKLLQDTETLFVSAAGEPELLTADQFKPWKMREGTLYLPDDVQAIDEHGMFKVGGMGVGDVFAQTQDKCEYRRFIKSDVGYTCLDTDTAIEAASIKLLLKSIEVPKGFVAKVIFNAKDLVYVRVSKRQKHADMTLNDHKAMAASVAKGVVSTLRLNHGEAKAILDAAEHHDDGKAHELWQMALRGTAEGEPLAKSQYFYNPKLLAGLRHELVSALDANADDLVTWLIASHHGRCRPAFPLKAYDRHRLEESAVFNDNLPYLLERLTAKYGQWGLAYLEAIVRGIDIQSEEES